MLAECLMAWARGGGSEDGLDPQVAATVVAHFINSVLRQLKA